MNSISTLVLRISMAAVFLWFGVQQFLNPGDWVGYLPSWTSTIPLSQIQLIYLNAAFEVVLGACLLLGFFTRIVAFLLAIHLAAITSELYMQGATAIAIRDFGLAAATLSLSLTSNHSHSIDRKYLNFLSRKFPGFNKEHSGHDSH